MQYYRMLDNLHLKNRWFLGEINFLEEDDIWKFISAGEVKNLQERYVVEIAQSGNALDLTFGEFEVLIANAEVAEIFGDEVQKVPITLKGEEKSYYMIVIKNEVDCIDRAKSDLTVWEVGNDIRPDLAGKYQNISKIIIDPETVKDFNICRVKDFNVAIIVSKKFKDLFEINNFHGIKFMQV